MTYFTCATAVALLLASAVATSETPLQATAERPEAKITFNIPVQPLNQALNNFAQQAGLRIVFDTADAAGITAPALNATLTADQALSRLLDPTKLRYEYLDAKTIAIHKEQAPTRSAVSADRTLRFAQTQEGSEIVGERKFRVAGTEEGSEPTNRPEDDSANGQPLEEITEITVTGTRQQLYSSRLVTSGVLGDKDPINVPFSISSYTSELAKLQANYTPAQILKNDPSAQNPGSFAGWQNNIILRGFTAAQGATRRDGMFTEHESDFPIEIYDRMEVIKGVGGFLYGFAEPGGIMNYITKRPTRDAFATLDVRYFNGTGLYTHLDAGGPVGDGRFGYRTNAVYQDSDDFTHPEDLRRFVAALALDAKVNDALLLRFDASYSDRQQPSYLGLPLTTAGTEPPEFDPSDLPVPPWARSKWTSSRASLRADYSYSENWTLQAQIGYERVDDQLTLGFVTSLEPDGDFEQIIFNAKNPPDFWRYDNRSAQILALGKLRTGPVSHELAFGGFHRDLRYDYLSSDGASASVSANLHAIEFGPRPLIPAAAVTSVYGFDLTEKHLFVGDTMHLGARWQVMAGARHVDISETPDYDAVSEVSPSGAILFKPTPNSTLYTSYARSLQYGTRAPCLVEDITNPCELLAPIKAKQVEVGAKARLSNSLDLGLAFYRIELPSDYIDPVLRRYGRFGEQVNQGLELTATGNLLPNLAVVAGFGYLDAELARNADPSLNGNRAAAVARTTANLFVNYGMTRVPGLSFTAGLYRVGSRYLDLQNQVPVDGYWRTDLGAQYRFESFARYLTLRANVNNVFDEFYWEGLGPFNHAYYPGQGRAVIISAQMELF